MPGPSGPCGLCGQRTWARGGVCTRCVHHHRHKGYHPADGLEGGRWVPVGGVMRWVEDEPPRAFQVQPITLAPEAMRRGYSQYRQGSRTDFAITAYREYQRLHKRRTRAA